MIVGICGLGFVGQAIESFMKDALTNTLIQGLVVYDKYKKINNVEALISADLLYICIPTPYEEPIKSYNMNELDSTLALLAKMQYKGLILIKSTVLPDYCETVNTNHKYLKIIHNPEFLSAATARDDFKNQKHIILGYTSQSESNINSVKTFYETLFPLSKISITMATASALAKLACNSFYAIKIQFFTELFLLSKQLDIDYDEVKQLMLNNQWIHPMHTMVPGHDGQLSFGGACLPKDISALNQFMIRKKTHNGVIEAAINERNYMRT
jgi:nucleotide sugar dehydrogenase